MADKTVYPIPDVFEENEGVFLDDESKINKFYGCFKVQLEEKIQSKKTSEKTAYTYLEVLEFIHSRKDDGGLTKQDLEKRFNMNKYQSVGVVFYLLGLGMLKQGARKVYLPSTNAEYILKYLEMLKD